MMNTEENYVRAIMEAQRKQGLGHFHNDPVKEALLQSSTPVKAMLEDVYVEFTPSALTDEYTESWFNQVDRVFRGSNCVNRPVLTGDDESDKILFSRYLETIFWRKMVSVNGEYLKGNADLKQEMDYRICAPALYTNAVNCVGIVKVHHLAIRLVPKYANDYQWEKRILSKELFMKVTHWIEECTRWGFQAYFGFNSSREGNLDFMLMTAVETDVENGVTTGMNQLATNPTEEGLEGPINSEAGRGRTAKFVISSQRAASNIVALYRYFFHNERIKYITDTRLTYSYSSYEESVDIVDYVVSKMIYDNNVPTWLDHNQNYNNSNQNQEESATHQE